MTITLRLKTQAQTTTVCVTQTQTIAQLLTTLQDSLYKDSHDQYFINPSIGGERKQNNTDRLEKVPHSTAKIRLVYQGQLLELSSTVFDAGLDDDSCVHCMITNVPQNKPSASSVVVPTDADQYRGFGSLRSSQPNYSFEDIEALRLTYFPQIVQFSQTQPQSPDEEPHRRWLRLEEEWMQLQSANASSEFYLNVGRHVRPTPPQTQPLLPRPNFFAEQPPPTEQDIIQSDARTDALRAVNNMRTRIGMTSIPTANDIDENDEELVTTTTEHNNNGGGLAAREGTNCEFVAGFLMGFLLGIIMVFWLGESSISKKQKGGVLCGIIVNVVLQFVGHGGDSSSNHLRGSGTNSTLVGTMEAGQQVLIPVSDVAGRLPLSSVGSSHYNTKTRHQIPEIFG